MKYLLGRLMAPPALALIASAMLVCPSLALAQGSEWATQQRQARDDLSSGQFERAVQAATKSVQLSEAKFGPDSGPVASCLTTLGIVYHRQGRFAEAEPPFKRAFDICVSKGLKDQLHIAPDALNNLAGNYQRQGKFAEVKLLFTQTLAILDASPDKKGNVLRYDDIVESIANVADALNTPRIYTQAETLYKMALDNVEKINHKNDRVLMRSLRGLGGIYFAQEKYAEAEPLYTRLLAIKWITQDPNSVGIAVEGMNNKAAIAQKAGRYTDAETLVNQAMALNQKFLYKECPTVAADLARLAELSLLQVKLSDAEQLYKRSLAMRVKTQGPNHLDVAACLDSVAALYKAQGRDAEAAPLLAQADAIRKNPSKAPVKDEEPFGSFGPTVTTKPKPSAPTRAPAPDAAWRAEYDAANEAYLADLRRYQRELEASRTPGGENVKVTPPDPALKERLKEAERRLR